MRGFGEHTELIRGGDAQTEYNSNLTTIMRLDTIYRTIMQVRGVKNIEAMELWLVLVHELHGYLEGLMTTEEILDLEKVEIKNLARNITVTNAVLSNYYHRIDKYYRRVRYYLQLKGLGVTAKIEDDPRKVINR